MTNESLTEKMSALINAAHLWGHVEATSLLLGDRLEAEREVRVAEKEFWDLHAQEYRSRKAVNYHLGEGE